VLSIRPPRFGKPAKGSFRLSGSPHQGLRKQTAQPQQIGHTCADFATLKLKKVIPESAEVGVASDDIFRSQKTDLILQISADAFANAILACQTSTGLELSFALPLPISDHQASPG
jgi:hypothetical protein